MKVFCCLAVLVIHKPISFVFCYVSLVKLIPRSWKLAEEEGNFTRHIYNMWSCVGPSFS